MVARNPHIYIEGMVPHLGSRLSIEIAPFGALLSCIVVIHGMVFTFTYCLNRR